MGSPRREHAIARAAEAICADRERERQLLDGMRKCERTVYSSDLLWSCGCTRQIDCEHRYDEDADIVPGLTDEARARLGDDADGELQGFFDRGGHYEPCSRQADAGYDHFGNIRERPLEQSEWCDSCRANIPAVQELRKLRARKGGRMSALMRAYRMEVK